MLKEIFARRSVRSFTDEPVTKEQITELLRAAMNAPSARNRQEWRFVVLTGRTNVDKVQELLPFNKMMLEAPVAIIVSADQNEAATEGHSYLDCGAAIENLLLEVVNQGLGACWCGLAPVEKNVVDFRAAFGIPTDQIPMGVIAVGHPAKEIQPRVDQYKEEYVTWLES